MKQSLTTISGIRKNIVADKNHYHCNVPYFSLYSHITSSTLCAACTHFEVKSVPSKGDNVG